LQHLWCMLKARQSKILQQEIPVQPAQIKM
jgi:hypothetical protein